MAIANPASWQPAIEYPIILALPGRVSEEMLLAIGAKNAEFQFETTADGRLVVKPLTGFFASGAEGELFRQVANWNREVLLNPRDRSVTLYRPGHEPVRAADIAAVVIGEEMPGFVLDAVAVFAAGEEPA